MMKFIKRILASLLLALLLNYGQAQTVESIINVPIDNTCPSCTYQALLYEPPTYNTATLLPMIIFLHGAGEGTPPVSNIYNSQSAGGPAYYIEHGLWPVTFINPANGKSYQYIVLSPQAANTGWSTSAPQLDVIVQYMIKNFKVDPTRVYLTGLSAGGDGIYQYIIHNGFIPVTEAPAVGLMSMAVDSRLINNTSDATVIKDNVHVWGFGSETDVYGIETHVFIIGAYDGNEGVTPPGLGPLGIWTGYTGGHCCWGQFYDPAFVQMINGQLMNMYEWYLQYQRPIANLPITLYSFTGIRTGNETTLDWTTSTESNSDNFVVEQSLDSGRTFQALATVPSKASNGNSSTPIQYEYIVK